MGSNRFLWSILFMLATVALLSVVGMSTTMSPSNTISPSVSSKTVILLNTVGSGTAVSSVSASPQTKVMSSDGGVVMLSSPSAVSSSSPTVVMSSDGGAVMLSSPSAFSASLQTVVMSSDGGVEMLSSPSAVSASPQTKVMSNDGGVVMLSSPSAVSASPQTKVMSNDGGVVMLSSPSAVSASPQTKVMSNDGGVVMLSSPSGVSASPQTKVMSSNGSVVMLSSPSAVSASPQTKVMSSNGGVVMLSSPSAVSASPQTKVMSNDGGVVMLSSPSAVSASPQTKVMSSNGSVVMLSSPSAVSASPQTKVMSNDGGVVMLSSPSAVSASPQTKVMSSNGSVVMLSSPSAVSASPQTKVMSSNGGVVMLSSPSAVSASPQTKVMSNDGGVVMLSSPSAVSASPQTKVMSSNGSVVMLSSPSAVSASPQTKVMSNDGGVVMLSSPSAVSASPQTKVMSSDGSVVMLSSPSAVSASLQTKVMSSDGGVVMLSSSEVIAPTSTRPIAATSSTIPNKTNKTYYEYKMSFTLTGLVEGSINKTDIGVLKHLITECSDSFTLSNSIYFKTFQRYITNEICALYSSLSQDCFVRVTKLRCGSVIANYSVTLGVDSSLSNSITNGSGYRNIEQQIQKGVFGAFVAKNSSFVNNKFTKEVTKPDPPDKQAVKYKVFVIVTLGYTWKEFCGVVEKHFKERIADRSQNIEPNNIYIINRDENCDKPNDHGEEIKVHFVVIGEDQDKLTIRVGEDLMDLVKSGLTRKLGNLFENKIIKVEFGGENAPPTGSGLSDTDKIWLAVGVTLGVIFLLLFFYMCCCRQPEKKSDTERDPNYFTMNEVDNAKKGDTVLVNEGFDNLEENPTMISQRNSTFKDNPTSGNKPVTKSNNDEGSALPSDNSANLAPLGEGEDTDDELDMTVPDVAIEADIGKDPTPPGKSLTIPPNPSHMAIKDLAKFLEDTGNESQKNKEYEDLNKSMTAPETYAINTQDRNRSDVMPNPETRVKLPGQNNYINANFVKDHHGKEGFIVTQHPLSNTMRDFWSMVWDKNVSVIVMVNSEEKDLENYHNYWLDHKNSLTIYGHMQVKTNQAKPMEGYVITKFVLQNSQEADVTKTVDHFRFTNWPEKGLPDVKEFAQFVRSIEGVRFDNPSPPVVVHCSQGQGYTGVILATDIGLRVFNESDKKSTINVFDCVEKMRKDRNGIICSKELYNFIYNVLSALIKENSSTDSKL